MPQSNCKLSLAKNLNYLLLINGKTQKDLAEYLHISPSAVNAWCKGSKSPRIDKLQIIAEYFCIEQPADLLEENFFVGNNNDLNLLFDLAKDLEPADIKVLCTIAAALKKRG